MDRQTTKGILTDDTPRSLRLARKELRLWKDEMKKHGWQDTGVYVAEACLRSLQKGHQKDRAEVQGLAQSWYEKEHANAVWELKTKGRVSDPCFKFMETE